MIAIGLVAIVLVSMATVTWFIPEPSTQDAIVLKPYGSLSNAIQGLLNGEIDILPIDQFNASTLKLLNNSNVKLVRIPSFGFTYIGVNLRNWPLSNLTFRQALFYAFDRPGAVSQILGGSGETLDAGLFSSAYSASGWPRYTSSSDNYNTTMAKNILEAKGFNVRPDGPYRNDPLTNLTLNSMFILSRLSEPDDVAAADMFAKQMQSIGIPIISLPMTDVDFNLALRTYTFDLFVDSNTNTHAPTWLYTMFSSENNIAPVPLSTNLVGFNNSIFDNQANELMTSDNQSAVKAAAEACQEILTSNLPALPIFSKDLLVATSPRVTVTPVVGSLEETIRQTALSTMQTPGFTAPLRIGFASGFQNLDPATTSNSADWIALHLATEPLISFDRTGNPQPDLTAWTSSYRTLTLHIRPNATYYTGQPITANDVAATLNWMMRNVAPSSPLYWTMNEITNVDLTDNSTVKVSLSIPDNFAILGLANLFALPADRLASNPLTPDFLARQLLVSSGPFVFREFTPTEGVYMQMNGPYFGQAPRTMNNINVYEDNIISPRSQVEISSSPLIINGEPVENASYLVCIYYQGGVQSQCITGTPNNQGVYSATWKIDPQQPFGTYLVESTLDWTLPTGRSLILKDETATLGPLPILQILAFAALLIAFVLVLPREELQLRDPSKRPRRRPSR